MCEPPPRKAPRRSAPSLDAGGIAKATAYIDPTLHGVTLTVKITATMRGSTVTTTTWYQAK